VIERIKHKKDLQPIQYLLEIQNLGKDRISILDLTNAFTK